MFQCGDTYATFDGWAMCVVRQVHLPQSLEEFRLAVAGLLMQQAAGKRQEEGAMHPKAHAYADRRKSKSPLKYRIRWRGTKSPIGAVVGGVAVAFASNGMLADAGGHALGSYDRISEFTGLHGDEQEMIVHVSSEVAFPGALLLDRLNMEDVG